MDFRLSLLLLAIWSESAYAEVAFDWTVGSISYKTAIHHESNPPPARCHPVQCLYRDYIERKIVLSIDESAYDIAQVVDHRRRKFAVQKL